MDGKWQIFEEFFSPVLVYKWAINKAFQRLIAIKKMNKYSYIRNRQSWKQHKCLSTDKWINKPWSIHTMGYHLSLRRKEILTHFITRVTLENIMLNEISQSQKGNYCMIPFIWSTRIFICIETENKIIVARGWGRGRWREQGVGV